MRSPRTYSPRLLHLLIPPGPCSLARCCVSAVWHGPVFSPRFSHSPLAPDWLVFSRPMVADYVESLKLHSTPQYTGRPEAHRAHIRHTAHITQPCTQHSTPQYTGRPEAHRAHITQHISRSHAHSTPHRSTLGDQRLRRGSQSTYITQHISHSTYHTAQCNSPICIQRIYNICASMHSSALNNPCIVCDAGGGHIRSG